MYIHYNLSHPTASPTRKGRPPKLVQQQHQRLIEIATSSALHRHICLIAELSGITASENTIRKAFEAEGYHRCIARIKPWLSDQAKQRRY
ncbi:hypothetical protein BGX38DRAFT_152224 [Terfezia claveryi]|nr:hypothetical protein BGX38DRAFT_152224 [Terfezia claveryi]